MKNLLAILLSALCLQLSAQTRLIAHKSHSGTEETFKAAFINELFDINSSNYGHAPERIIRTARLDSLIYISETVAIMVTSNHCRKSRSADTTLWRAGRDTVFYHPLFSKQHSLDSIKQVLDRSYYFVNKADSVVFIGYDNGSSYSTPGKSKENSVPLIGISNDRPSGNLFFMVSIIGIFSLVTGWIWSKSYQRNHNAIKVRD